MVTICGCKVLVEAFDEEFPRVLRGMSTRTEKVIAAWIEWRAVAFEEVKDQTRPMMVAAFQDDFTVASISEDFAGFLEG